jgi:hypothetical protein
MKTPDLNCGHCLTLDVDENTRHILCVGRFSRAFLDVYEKSAG